mgnify:CR=1 FL=1
MDDWHAQRPYAHRPFHGLMRGGSPRPGWPSPSGPGRLYPWMQAMRLGRGGLNLAAGKYQYPPTRDPCRRQKPIPPENKFPRQENLRWKTDYLRQENLVAGKYQFLSTPQYPHSRESITISDMVCHPTRHHIRESSSCSCRRLGQT